MKLTEAQIARVRELQDATGRITPAVVVVDAERKDSPLHPLFEWNKAKAAQSHWLDTAREIIGSVVVVRVTKTTTMNVSGYVRDTTTNGKQGYISLQALRDDPERARQSLIYTLDVAAGHMRRALQLAEPLGLDGEIDQLLEQIMGVHRLIESKAA